MLSDAERVLGRLTDSLDNIDLAAEFAGKLSFEELQQDTRSLYATIRCLEVISEASRHLLDSLKFRHADIPWRNIASAGNLYRQEYNGVHPDKIFETVLADLPQLREVVVREMALTAQASA